MLNSATLPPFLLTFGHEYLQPEPKIELGIATEDWLSILRPIVNLTYSILTVGIPRNLLLNVPA